MTTHHHDTLVLGGGSAGISVAARLRHKGHDVTIVDPARDHYYQPLWTLVGGGAASAESTRRPMDRVVPKGARLLRDAAAQIDPDDNAVTMASGETHEYDHLVVAPGIQLDWGQVPGLSETLGRDGVSSNYSYELAPKTWEFIRDLRSGTAVFTMPAGPIKCAGAPQKIAYLAADHWRREGVLDKIDVHLVLPTPKMFGIDVFSDVLDEVAADYGITVHLSSEVVELDPDEREVVVQPLDGGDKYSIPYDLVHAVPPQSAPDWVKASPLSTGDDKGYVEVDKHTMRHVRHDNVFALGDAGSTPNSKTGAAVRKQAPVVVANLLDVKSGREPSAGYGGYASCPIVTSNKAMLLAEFDYSMTHTKTIPLIDTTRPRYDMWLLKRYALPALYWNLMLKGRM